MKILILTQKVDINDPILGFFHQWLVEFAKRCDSLTVVCLELGQHTLPDSVKILSLGKENKRSRLQYVYRFYRYVWRERKNYDAVFVHMNHEYVVLGGLFWKLLGKKIALWYTHRQTSLKLRIAEKLSDIIFTSTKESFRVPSKKLNIMGHGIRMADYSCDQSLVSGKDGLLNILSIGRITEIKNCDTLIKAAQILKATWQKKFNILFIGSPVTPEDQVYFEELKKQVETLGLQDEVLFVGSVANKQIRNFYCKSNLTINLSPTGGTDKVVLESLASKTPAIVSNLAFKNLFGLYADQLMVKERDEKDLAQKIINFYEREDQSEILDYIYARVAKDYELENLIKEIIKLMS